MAQVQDAQKREFFERNIRPVLVRHCYECHSLEADDAGGQLRLDSRDGLHQGGLSGAAIVPGDADASLLIAAMEYRELEMPPDEKLSDEIIRDFRKWIDDGAFDPRLAAAAAAGSQPQADKDRADLWSLQPVTAAQVPQVDNAEWADTPVDRFVLDRLQKAGLQPVADAEPHALLRRVYFDLIGLPPSPEEQARFAADPSRTTLEHIVDRLLQSPRFGERWGRHWLDVVRYAESAGNSRDVLMPYAYRYRDYVIDAFNDDVPYDRFIAEQLAGDLLAADSPAERDRLQVATGLLAVGSKSLNGGNLELDIVDDQIDVVGKAFMGLTVSCARCHDHKFDPIPTADYYSLAGIFRSTETLYGGGTKRPDSAADKVKVYMLLGEGAEQRAQQVVQHDKRRDQPLVGSDIWRWPACASRRRRPATPVRCCPRDRTIHRGRNA